ncbi:hypothetical protein [Paraburkholderia gardini]|uniref:hypothetical protein n=1 Tax=Paraburkholderia gardini TaxID=2823469 RepID=UPI001D3F6C82|nr:hypothetical protein [Paraburkholderia gardini]CAG4893541.1 hypothetical protein R69919_01672 [Paraburkholderia gardini]
MNLDSILASSAAGVLSIPDIENFCAHNEIERNRFYDLCATSLAQDYLSGTQTFLFCDSAVNQLMGLAGYEVPDLFLRVFEAFDAGEYRHRNDSVEIDPVDSYTGSMLRAALLPPVVDA